MSKISATPSFILWFLLILEGWDCMIVLFFVIITTKLINFSAVPFWLRLHYTPQRMENAINNVLKPYNSRLYKCGFRFDNILFFP